MIRSGPLLVPVLPLRTRAREGRTPVRESDVAGDVDDRDDQDRDQLGVPADLHHAQLRPDNAKAVPRAMPRRITGKAQITSIVRESTASTSATEVADRIPTTTANRAVIRAAHTPINSELRPRRAALIVSRPRCRLLRSSATATSGPIGTPSG